MKRPFLLVGVLVGAFCVFLWASSSRFIGPSRAAVEMPAVSYLQGLTWLGHASFRLERGGVVVYFDPWTIAGEPHDADLILISHPHFDHLSAADAMKVAKVPGEGGKSDTVIVTVTECVPKLEEAKFPGTVQVVKPGEQVKVKGISIEAVPAYNTNKTFHPKEKEWAGFIVEVDGTRLYHAGDTDFIPEMETFRTDVALLPVSGTYVMTAEEAAEAAKAIKPKVAVPMHYGSIVGSGADAKRFQTLGGEVVVEVIPKEEKIKVAGDSSPS